MRTSSASPPQQPFLGVNTPVPTQRGKVRDVYHTGQQRILVATDRISAFDRVVGAVAGRGQILNQLAAWWLKQAEAVCPTHFIELLDAHCSLVHSAEVLPVEVIVRGHISGSTKTSLWTMYAAGARDMYGHRLPDGLQKNDKLPCALITPTSKAAQGGHDLPMTAKEIVDSGTVSAKLWAHIEAVAEQLFHLGQRQAEQAGLVLVDTKYEFGLLTSGKHKGQLVLIDEVHTPDSSRYWSLAAWRENPAHPQSMDKEQLRLWLAEQHYRGEGDPPALTPGIQTQISTRYAQVFEQLTGTAMRFDSQPQVERTLKQHLPAQ